MGYYVLSLVVGGLIGRVGVALVSDTIGWRWALGGLVLLPLGATVLMRFTLPNVALPRSDAGGASAFSRQLRNGELLEVIAGGCALFFTFIGVFSFVTYRLEAPPFGLAPTTTGLIFLLWGMGTLSPTAGNLAHRVGWRPVLTCTLAMAAVALLLSLAATMPMLIPALALLAAAMFAGTTAANLGVATVGGSDRGVTSAIYFSCYYSSGALAGFLPGLAWQTWQWPGVVGVGLVALSVAMSVLLLR